MEKELNYRLSNPNYTIYHRAALGGLAATVRAWGKSPPQGINAVLTKDTVRLSWDSEEMTDQEALRRILEASFKLTDDKIIDLPGQGIKAGNDDLRLAIHNGICGTFLQHNKMRPGEKEPRRFTLKSDDDGEDIFTYKAVNDYAHKKAQGTKLFEVKLKGNFPSVALIPQSVVPGAMSGALELQAPADEVILLMFLMVGSAIFLLRPRTYKEKAQYCIVVPDVIDLEKFVRALQRIAIVGTDIQKFSNSYLGRVVGGAEEAALRFLVDLRASEDLLMGHSSSICGCLAIAMGKVAWDKNQINRSIIVKLKADYPELEVFRAANQLLGKTKVIKLDKGESYAVPASPIPELIAANLAAERHWCSHFIELVKEQKDFNQMRYSQGGLKAMNEAIKDADDKAVIRAFQEAWKMTMGEFGERARRGEFLFDRKVETEREKMRNTILRAKTADALASWFLRFCADATKGGSLKAMREDSERIRKFIFNQRNFDRFQNLCLFALVSYASEETKSTIGGQN